MTDWEKQHFDFVWNEISYERIQMMELVGQAFEKIVFGTQFGTNTEEIRELIKRARQKICFGMQRDPEKRTVKMIDAVDALAKKGVTEARYELAVFHIKCFCQGLCAPSLDWVNYIQYKEV